MAPKIRENLAFRRVAGELFIVDAAASRLHELNGPAALIWEGLAAGKSEPRIISELLAEFEVSEKEARSDLREFLGELSKSGLIL
ncbi:MAG: hypothetical protein A2X28_04775 [Elusimicrobia bacterium GWA2_56_46]|nr:MAG: hypothetical protein A2X28_04775 [Elusimicrobia bacterium GWA2_56_46]OGR56185.1 MAG: hypothetical protein A2X39_08195 [Elusimicrobia bacterium GWC2_56_31]HBB66902.1 hypothetical protein [Elusimicrobiota bacterium]HBW23038.1 hypothetical protein [Elusimicrobiota bacterium]